MPVAPPKPCKYPGCAGLVRGGYCDTHTDQAKEPERARDRDRGSSAQRGYGFKWQKASGTYLKRNPLCVRCEGRGLVVGASDVDHIVPHGLKDAIDSGDPDRIREAQRLFWDSAGNWQSLCHVCHSRKTAAEDGGFGRPHNRDLGAAQGVPGALTDCRSARGPAPRRRG